jgi:hypothetical protein
MGMSEQDKVNLTGVWNGLYSYPQLGKSVSFVATLIETVSWVTGSTHEPCVFGDGAGNTLYATLLGSRASRTVLFRKTYDSAGPNYSLVEYEGVLSSDGNEISGRWAISTAWSGSFLMIRSGGQSVARTRKTLAKV